MELCLCFFFTFFEPENRFKKKKQQNLEGIPWWSSAKNSARSLPRFNPWSGNRDPTSCVASRVNQNNKMMLALWVSPSTCPEGGQAHSDTFKVSI